MWWWILIETVLILFSSPQFLVFWVFLLLLRDVSVSLWTMSCHLLMVTENVYCIPKRFPTWLYLCWLLNNLQKFCTAGKPTAFATKGTEYFQPNFPNFVLLLCTLPWEVKSPNLCQKLQKSWTKLLKDCSMCDESELLHVTWPNCHTNYSSFHNLLACMIKNDPTTRQLHCYWCCCQGQI